MFAKRLWHRGFLLLVSAGASYFTRIVHFVALPSWYILHLCFFSTTVALPVMRFREGKEEREEVGANKLTKSTQVFTIWYPSRRPMNQPYLCFCLQLLLFRFKTLSRRLVSNRGNGKDYSTNEIETGHVCCQRCTRNRLKRRFFSLLFWLKHFGPNLFQGLVCKLLYLCLLTRLSK